MKKAIEIIEERKIFLIKKMSNIKQSDSTTEQERQEYRDSLKTRLAECNVLIKLIEI